MNDVANHLVRLHAPDVLLDRVVEILHAERDAVEPHLSERLQRRLIHHARIDFDGNLGVGRQGHFFTNRSEDAAELLGREIGRRAAAEVNLPQVVAA